MTSHSEGIKALQGHLPEENEDALMIFIGDQGDNQGGPEMMADTIRRIGFNPVAFGMLHVAAQGDDWGEGHAVVDTATLLGIPCFAVDENMFRADDPYAVTRLLQNLIATTPVGARPAGQVAQRKSLIEEILETELLAKPVWA